MKKVKVLPKKDGHKGPVLFVAGKQIKANEVIEVPDDVAADLIFRSKAELVTETKKEK